MGGLTYYTTTAINIVCYGRETDRLIEQKRQHRKRPTQASDWFLIKIKAPKQLSEGKRDFSAHYAGVVRYP